MKLTEILAISKGIKELKKQLDNLENYTLTPAEIKLIDQQILKNLKEEQVLDTLIAIGNWYCSHNTYEDWKKIKSELSNDNEISQATKKYLAVLD